MRYKLFKKYFFATTAIIAVCLVIMMLTLVFVFNNHLSNSRYDVLSKSCDSVVDYLKEENSSEENLLNIINTVSDVSDIDLFITDNTGKVIMCGCDDCKTGERCDIFGAQIPLKIIQKASIGQTMEYGTLEIYEKMHFAVAKPVLNEKGNAVAIVFSSSSVQSVKAFLNTVFRFCLISAAIPIIIMFFAIYAMSYNLVRPLKIMSEAAKAMAKGDFSKRVPVTSDDEIGELAVSFNLMTNSLVQLEGMRRSFIANVSHELKTPMTTIGGFIDGIIDGTIEEDKQSYYLNIVSEEVKRLSRLVQSMLSMSKLESGEYVLKPELFDLRELICTIVISQEQRIEKKKIDIKGLDLIDSVSINADKDLIHQVIYNLVDNAIKFTADGGEVSFALSSSGKEISFSISNTGAGIPENELPYVFQRFYKADKSRSANKNSTGLGLYIAKNIVTAHGGKIYVSSKENEITTFKVTFPL